jgi:regulator of cell morphogenesis and NO signaling
MTPQSPSTAANPVPFAGRAVGEIAATLPGATAVFRRFDLDFCCGGAVRLDEAALKRGIDLAAIDRALAALDHAPDATAPRETGALIDHILARFHETHRAELPELLRLARKVEAVHAAHPQAPLGLGDELYRLGLELESHMQKEELVLFPLMRDCASAGEGPSGAKIAAPPTIRHPIARMRHEHDAHGQHLATLRALTHDLVLPADACRSWQALYAGLAKFIDDLMEHVHLENNLLFPRFAPDFRD